MCRARATVGITTLLVLLIVAGVPIVRGAETPAGADAGAVDRTSPRLSFIDGQVSFWRPGAEDWAAARVNAPLAPGDELNTGSPGNLEVQIGPRAYVRAWANTQLGLAGLEPDFVQLKVTTGHVSLDIRWLDPGHTIELDTPNAAFTIERPGYYRVNVTESRTSFITRRGGRATVTPATGTAAAIAPSEEVIVEGADSPLVTTYVAPELDAWDRWNYARTDALIDSVSARYVSPGVYGVDDLDHHGSWRIVETYGPVWVPTGVPAGWVPYSTGTWMWDPYYGWSWVDPAPWGWAPYHYGRWVFVSDFWAWAPGPVVVRPVYAPALVAFFGLRVGVSIGAVGPAVGWVALGWGEPLIPWWGRVGFVGVPWWAGWGGPWIVNNVVINRTTIVHVHEINVYRNATVRNAVVLVPRERFGHGPVTGVRVVQMDPRHLEPVRGRLEVSPVRASLTPDVVRGARPPEAILGRRVVATRAPEDPARWLKPQGIEAPSEAPSVPPRLVPAPAGRNSAEIPPRPPFGASRIERPRSPQPPRLERAQPPSAGPAAPRPQVSRPAPATPQPGTPTAPSRPTPSATGAEPRPAPSAPRVQHRPSAPAPPSRSETPPPRVESRPAPPAPRVERAPAAPAPPRAQVPSEQPQPPAIRDAPRPQMRPLPGEPANRLFPERSEGVPERRERTSVEAPGAAPPGSVPREHPRPANSMRDPRSSGAGR
jgi:hypothetical protein